MFTQYDFKGKSPDDKEVEQIQPRKNRVNNNTIVNLQPVHVDSVVNIGKV